MATEIGTEKRKPTSLYFWISDEKAKITPLIFQRYLENFLKLKKRAVVIKICSFDRKGSFIEANVQFPSVNKAKKSRSLICKANQSMIVSMYGFNILEIIAKCDRMNKIIESKRKFYLQHHKEKIATVSLKLASIKTKNVDISLFQKVMDEKEALKARKSELEHQSDEFVNYCKKLQDKIESLKKRVYTRHCEPIEQKILALQMEFARECGRFQKALPIYARRNDIISKIDCSQVSVLIGETGSGKSTQLVQYLYDSGLAKDKMIACTQPRKVAATSLAEYVGNEMCCSQNTLVASKVTAAHSVKDVTKILYLTDHALLNECIQDRQFSKYSCLVIDEAHERSLHTDILLAFIKQCLPLRPDMKVVITSATIDPQLFVDYFGKTTTCPVIRVSGRTFPVDVMWCPFGKELPNLHYPNMPYVEKAIELAIKIHSEEPEGAILAFLTSAFEIEVACNLTEKAVKADQVVVLPLHGRLQSAEQKKVFQSFEGKRKIVFSTNVAETSITIPDVKYIIDSGFAKEMCFDPKRNMNTLEVRRISKSSAEQRKGRAGRVSAGKCFRLFAEEDYEAMPQRGLPEILRVHLTHAVLKLFEFGVTDVLQFDFVEMPDIASLTTAVDMLKFLGAVDENTKTLSETGRSLALFPIDPQLGKIILDGIQENIILEAVIATAVSSLGGNIFFRGQTDEMKNESDRQKIKFLHPGGDQLTSLNVYKEWVAEKKDARNRWCVANYINAKSLRLVEEMVKEHFHIISTHLKIKRPSIIVPNVEVAEKKLLKIYFNSFIWNLGIYLGHDRAGYMTPKIAGEQLIAFPGSSLAQCNVVPQYLVYEKTLKTTQQYMLQIVAVENEWIEEAKEKGILSNSMLQKVEKYFVRKFTISNLGPEVLRKGVIRKKKEVIGKFKAICKDSPLALDCSIEEGTASIHCTLEYEKELTSELLQKFKLIKNDLKKQVEETGVTKPEDDVKLLLGIGGCIQFVLMPLDFHTLIVKGPVVLCEAADWTERMIRLLENSGEIVRWTRKDFPKETRVYVKFSDPRDAEKALKSSNKQSLPDNVSFQPQTIRSRGDEGSRLFRIQIEWERRERKESAFVEFQNDDDLGNASRVLVNRPYDSGILFKPARNPRPNTYQLFMPKVGRQTEEQIRNIIRVRIGDDTNFKIKYVYTPSFITTEQQLDALSKQLKQTVLKFATNGQFRINLPQPKDFHYTFRSYVDFNDPEEGQRAMNHLENENICGKPLKVILLLSSFTRLSKAIYDLVKLELDEVKKDSMNVNIKPKVIQDKCILEISSGDIDAFVAAKKKVNSILRPCVVECESKFLQQYILSKECRNELDVIQTETETIIIQNLRTMSFCIYGKEQNSKQAEKSLRQKVKELEDNGIQVHDIRLKDPGMPPGAMRHVITLFGVDLTGIFQIEGIRRASIEPRKQILTVFSSDNALHSINKVIEDYRNSIKILSVSACAETNAVTYECCVCFTDIDDVKDIFRPECCGHTYHLDCVKMQLAPNTLTIPVTCASDDCSLPFVWQDFENLMKKKVLSLYRLVECSLKTYLGANQDKVRNCPTPDCCMIYTVSEKEGERFICKDCGSHICTSCHVQYHDGLSCRMYQAVGRDDEQLEEWLRSDSGLRKRCPSCSAPIEKISGCNKVTCTQCQANICWVCLEYFLTENGCYAHLQRLHTGFV